VDNYILEFGTADSMALLLLGGLSLQVVFSYMVFPMAFHLVMGASSFFIAH